MPTVYVCFCPAGKDCKKGGSRLGAFPDEAAARAKIVQHLMNSPFHSYDQGTADGFAEGAELAEEDAPPEPDHKPTKWGWKEDKQWRGPYEASWGKGGGKGSSSSTALCTGKDSSVVAAVARAEAAARTAARMAHAAASAFEAEASILRDSLDSLQKR
jgi:hypothetical protein